MVVMAGVFLAVGLTFHSVVWDVVAVVLFVVTGTIGLFAFRAVTGGRSAVRQLLPTPELKGW
jgi:hypothetical protein